MARKQLSKAMAEAMLAAYRETGHVVTRDYNPTPRVKYQPTRGLATRIMAGEVAPTLAGTCNRLRGYFNPDAKHGECRTIKVK